RKPPSPRPPSRPEGFSLMGTSPFVEPLPPQIERKLRAVRADDEPVHVQLAADMAEDLTFGERWLVVTDRRVLLLAPGGAADTVELPLKDLTAVRLEACVGGGRLALARGGAPPTFVYCTSSLAPRFAEVAEGIGRLRKGEAPSLPERVGRSRCPRCGRLL